MRPTIDALTRDFSPAHRPLFSGFLGLRASVVWFALSMVAFPRKRTWLNCVRDARTPDQGGADPERTPICIWVSLIGFRQPGLLCAFRRRLVTVHVSPVSPSLTKEGNAACARQVCRKVTTRETRDQRRISTWYQNLRVLSAHEADGLAGGLDASGEVNHVVGAVPAAEDGPMECLPGLACILKEKCGTRGAGPLRVVRPECLYDTP